MRKFKLVKKGFGLLWYKVFQKYFWNYTLNLNENKFSCKGRLINCSIEVKGRRNYIEISDQVKLTNVRITIHGNGHTLKIGSRSVWDEWGWIRIEDENNSVLIENDGDFRGCFFSCSDRNTQIHIGEGCLFSNDVVIRTSDSHSILNNFGQRINPGKSVEIANKVWIGNGALVLKGSNIGENCVIGTKAVVSGKTFPEGCIIVGNPAKVIMEGVGWCKPRL